MAYGESHAKKTVTIQAESAEKMLSTGHGADLATHGAALLLLLQMVKPIFNARLVTDEECADRMGDCPGRTGRRTDRRTDRKMDWPTAAVVISVVISGVGLVLKFV